MRASERESGEAQWATQAKARIPSSAARDVINPQNLALPLGTHRQLASEIVFKAGPTASLALNATAPRGEGDSSRHSAGLMMLAAEKGFWEANRRWSSPCSPHTSSCHRLCSARLRPGGNADCLRYTLSWLIECGATSI